MRASHRPQLKAVLLNDTSVNNHHGCRLVVSQIRELCLRHGMDLWHTVKLGEDWRTSPYVDKIAASQLVIVNGEGTLHSSKRNALLLARSAEFCRDRGIPAFLINSVYQNNNDELARYVSMFDGIYVRESFSQQALERQHIRAEVVPDMTLSFPWTGNVHAARHSILFTDSAHMPATSNLLDLARQTVGAQLINLRSREPTAAARLLSLVMGCQEPVKKPKARKRPPTDFERAAGHSLRQLLTRVAAAEFIVTGRFHMVCFALLTQTPFIALPSNTHKTVGMLTDAGLSHRFVEGVEECSVMPWQSGEADRVDGYVARAQRSIDSMFSAMRSRCHPATAA